MSHLILSRYNQNDKRTLGTLCDGEEIVGMTLELPWNDNHTDISCIPDGTYEVVPYSSEKWPEVFHILDVSGREAILIHWGSFVRNTKGCILVGKSMGKLLKEDAIFDTHDKIAEMYRKYYNGFRLTITTELSRNP